MTPQQVETLFRMGKDYAFARWSCPIAPVVFGVDDATLAVVKGAFEAVVALAGHRMAGNDPELGANCMVFFLRDWGELAGLPQLERLLPGVSDLAARLQADDADRYRGIGQVDGDEGIGGGTFRDRHACIVPRPLRGCPHHAVLR